LIGAGLIIAACICGSSQAFLTKSLFVKYGLGAYEQLYYRAICYVIFALIGLKMNNLKVTDFDRRHTSKILLRALLGIILNICYVIGVSTMEVSIASVLFYINPIFMMLLATIFLGEVLKLPDILACLSSFLGVVFIIKPHFIFGNSFSKNGENPEQAEGYLFSAILMMVAALCTASVYIIFKKSGAKIHYFVMTFYYGLISVLVIPFIIMLFGIERSELRSEYVPVLILTSFLNFASSMCVYKAFTYDKASRLTTLSYSEILLTFFIDTIVLQTSIDGFSILGAIFITVSSFSVAIMRCVNTD